MHLVQLLLPLRDNEGQTFSREDFQQVRAELTERFGGVTAFTQSPAVGLWKEDDDSEPSRDELILFEVMTDALDQPWWADYRKQLEARFRQRAIVVRALPAQAL